MEHTKSSFSFSSKNDNWQVDYTYIIKTYYGHDNSELKVAVYLNNELYWDFEKMRTYLPYTKTEHPTKSQAKEIISAARKLYKENYKLRDDRDKKLSKLGINNS